MKLTLILLIAGLIFLVIYIRWNCQEKTSTILNSRNQIVKQIPQNMDGENYYPYKSTRKKTLKAGLNFIDKGYDSLFIRIWYGYNTSMQVVDIKATGERWNSELHVLQLKIIKDKWEVDSVETVSFYPKSGWNLFIKNLFSLKILELPNDSDLRGYDRATDGNIVIVEIATKEKYRIYSYTDPFVHLQFPEAIKIENIMELIESELGVKRLEKI